VTPLPEPPPPTPPTPEPEVVEIPANGSGAFILHVRDAIVSVLQQLEALHGVTVQPNETSTLDRLPALTLWPAGPRLPQPGDMVGVDQEAQITAFSWDLRVIIAIDAGTRETTAQDLATLVMTDAAQLLGTDPTLGGLVQWMTIEPAHVQLQLGGQVPELVPELRLTAHLLP
jgi:hypothetical protein